MYGKQEIYALLAEKGIEYDKLEHEAVFTMEEMDRAGLTARGGVFKNLFLRNSSGSKHYLVSVPEEAKVDMKELAKKIGSSRLSFASAERLMKYLGVVQGCVSPLGVLNDAEKSVTLVFDADVKDDDIVGVHPNDNTATMWMRFDALKGIIAENGTEITTTDFEKIHE